MISVCMIAKNEEAWLDECLRHLSTLNPEIILVDTGSTDRTKEIGASHGAQIFESPWAEDFSAPRNLSLSKATRPWILVIDPDERIAARDFEKIRAHIAQDKVKAYAFQTRNYTQTKMANTYTCDGSFSEELDYSFFFLSCKVRLFKNNLGIRFKGRVHETVSDSVIAACKPGEFEESEVLIHHYGCDATEIKKKNKRELYRRLTEKKILEEPNNPEAFVEFGRECLAVKDFERALRSFIRAYELDPTSPYYRLELVRAFFRAGRGADSKPLLEQALRDEPAHPEYLKYHFELIANRN